MPNRPILLSMNTIQTRFDEAYPFLPNGLAPIVFHGTYGFIDDKGLQVISNQFRQIGEERSQKIAGSSWFFRCTDDYWRYSM